MKNLLFILVLFIFSSSYGQYSFDIVSWDIDIINFREQSSIYLYYRSDTISEYYVKYYKSQVDTFLLYQFILDTNNRLAEKRYDFRNNNADFNYRIYSYKEKKDFEGEIITSESYNKLSICEKYSELTPGIEQETRYYGSLLGELECIDINLKKDCSIRIEFEYEYFNLDNDPSYRPTQATLFLDNKIYKKILLRYK